MAAKGELPTRAEIDDKYKWNLQDIFPSEEAWENEFNAVSEKKDDILKFQGIIGESADNLYGAINTSNETGKRFSVLAIYAYLAKDTDLNNGDYQNMYNRIISLSAEISAASAFIQPEIISIPEDKFNKFLDDEKLKPYRHMLESSYKMKKHTLDSDKEKMLALLSPIGQIPAQAYSMLNDAELPFPKINTEEGEIQVSHGRYRAALYSNDRNYRRDVYKATYEPYNQLKNTMATLYNGRIKTRLINSQLRNYLSPLEAALYGNDIPVSVYENLVNSVNKNLPTLHRWAAIKKKALGLDELHPYDTYASLFPASKKDYSFDEAREIVLKALTPLGDDYIKALEYSFDNRWIDVYETKGKRSGAYSNSSGAGPHPFILLNWNNTLDDMFTLAHEIGHNMHSYFSEKNQPFHYAGYSIFVAEVASITNEALLLDYLLENSESKEEKMALIEKFLIGAQSTFFRQARFAEFEKMTHEKAASGEYLNAGQLTEEFAAMYKKYWGDEMVTDYEEGLSWARVHHLVKYNFYVYQYATGFAAAQSLSEQIKAEGEPAIERFLAFLSAGSSDYPINVLRSAGVDMSSEEPVNRTIDKINRYLDELEEMMGN